MVIVADKVGYGCETFNLHLKLKFIEIVKELRLLEFPQYCIWTVLQPTTSS